MCFNPNNNIIQLCAQGMHLEGKGKPAQAHKIFQQAFMEATNDFEKCISAHYVARHQTSVHGKLKWNAVALQKALQVDDIQIKAQLPSLYLNVAKCYEDLKQFDNARKHYDAALSFTHFLPDNGYGNMIRSGIKNGIERVERSTH